jgi:hypothetical protein
MESAIQSVIIQLAASMRETVLSLNALLAVILMRLEMEFAILSVITLLVTMTGVIVLTTVLLNAHLKK